MSNFEKNLATFKTDFKKHLNEEWNTDKAFFLQYVSARLEAAQAEFLGNGFNALAQEQGRIREALGSITKELSQRKP